VVWLMSCVTIRTRPDRHYNSSGRHLDGEELQNAILYTQRQGDVGTADLQRSLGNSKISLGRRTTGLWYAISLIIKQKKWMLLTGIEFLLPLQDRPQSCGHGWRVCWSGADVLKEKLLEV